MQFITITPKPKYQYEVDFKVSDAKLAFLYTFVLVTEETSKEWVWDEKRKRSVPQMVTHYGNLPLATKANDFKGDTNLIIQRGHLAWLISWILTKGIDFGVMINLGESERNRLGYNSDPELKLLPEWEAIFNGHPRGEYYVTAQKDSFNLISKYRGIGIELGTGLGKTEIILATISSIIDQKDGNILLLVPNNAIFDEIWYRAEADHIKHTGVQDHIGGWFDTSKRVNVINPVGFCNSSNYSDESNLEWMKNVKHVIIDEAHRLSSDSYVHIVSDICPNIERAVSFSGTMDKFQARHLHPAKCNLSDLYVENMLVTGYSGAVMISRKVVVDTQVYSIHADITDPAKYKDLGDPLEQDINWLSKLDLMVYSMKLPAILKRAYRHLESLCGKGSIMYLPVVTTESADYLGEVLRKQGFNVCVWYSGSVYLNGEYVGGDLDAVKQLNKDKKFDWLITSKVSYEGVDLKGLNGCLPIVGSNWSMISQPLGRSARGTELIVYLVEDTSNPMIRKQYAHRKSMIVKEYNVTKMESI